MTEPVSILKGSPNYKELKKRFSDRDRRMDSLYWVINEQGLLVPYRRRVAQEKYAHEQWLLDIIVKARQIGFCLSESTPVLTADLEWKTLDQIEVGQRVMACDEGKPIIYGSARKLRIATVEKKFEIVERAVEIEFETGIKLIATPQHRLLCRQRSGTLTDWRRVEEMKIGDVVRAVTDHWGPASAEDGWFGGLLDGEGSMRQKSTGGFELNVSQTAGAVLDRARQYLVDNHIAFVEQIDKRHGINSKIGNKDCHKLTIYRAGDAMRILGKCRPSRFDRQWWVGRKLPGDGNSWVKIISLRALPAQRMVDLQTSEKTFIANGFVSHNSTEIAIDIADHCIWRKNFTAGIIDYTLDDAKLKLQKVRTAYLGTPAAVQETVRLVKDNEEELKWSNGSTCYVGTSHRGGTLQYLHISEYGKIATDKPDVAREIKAAALNTIAPGQKVKIESTAHGTQGQFYDMVRQAEAKQKTGQTLSQLDFKLHFFAWWVDQKYAVQPNLAIVTNEMQEYFDQLRVKHGIFLSPEQKAWYVLKYGTLGRDDMHSEFPSCMEETFFNSLEGTWFKRELQKMREEHRVGHSIPHDPNYLVNTFWDIGLEAKNNQNAIWFHQTDGTRHRIIDYYENSGEGVSHYCTKVHEIGQKRGFTYGKHYGPHDIAHRSWASDAQTRKEIAHKLGVDFEVVPRVLDKEDAIEALRRMLALTWIDAEHCSRLVECLDNYRKVWSKPLAQWTSVPLHNWASNAADAGMTGAVGMKPGDIALADGSRSRNFKKVKGSQWAQ